MIWRTRKPSPQRPARPDDGPEDATVSDETRRAKEAAARAGRQLAEARARSPKAARTGEAIEEENRHNGFYLLIREALGSG